MSLVVGSLIFYAYGDLSLLKVLSFSIVINYVFLICMKKGRWRRFFLAVPVVINIGLLLYFKYLDFIITNVNGFFHQDFALRNLVQPVGISFFTFQQIAYVVAVYKGTVQLSILDYLIYILYFPKILMGPLADPADFCAQLHDTALKKINWDHIASGVKLFSFGLFKKIIMADTFAKAVSWGYANIGTATAMDWLFIMLFYTFEIYFDFSGYSDMAVGTSLMLNITLPINFDSPYKAFSIREFWKRWHISLTAFFTKYIYIPLGGSRKGNFVTAANTMLVFFVSGIWHGANWTFLLWGILHGAFCLFDRWTEKWQKKVFEPMRWMLAFAAVNVLWLLFRSDSILQWKTILRTICLLQNTAVSDGLIGNFAMAEQAIICHVLPFMGKLSAIRGFWMLLFTGTALCLCLIPQNNYRNREKLSVWNLILAAGAFVWSFTGLSTESVFVYFNF